MQLQVCGEMRTDEQMLLSLRHAQWRRQFSIQLRRCNASVLTRKLMMIGSGPKTLSRNTDSAQLVVK